MASSPKEKTKEELEAEKKIGQEAAKKEAERRKVMVHSGSGIGTGRYGFGPLGTSGMAGTAPTEYTVYKDDRGEYINIGDVDSPRAYWDSENQNWRGVGPGDMKGHARYWSTNVAKQSSGGGGGKRKKKPDDPKKPPKTYPGGETVDTGIPTDYADSYNIWQPVSSDGQGGTQTKNPLWDQYSPWVPDPAHGIWKNPGVINLNPKPI